MPWLDVLAVSATYCVSGGRADVAITLGFAYTRRNRGVRGGGGGGGIVTGSAIVVVDVVVDDDVSQVMS